MLSRAPAPSPPSLRPPSPYPPARPQVAPTPSTKRGTRVHFRGGCGSLDPEVRYVYTAAKMLRYELVQALHAAKRTDVLVSEGGRGGGGARGGVWAHAAHPPNPPTQPAHLTWPPTHTPNPPQAACTCEYCDGAISHRDLVLELQDSVFCPVVASNFQSNRRLW